MSTENCNVNSPLSSGMEPADKVQRLATCDKCMIVKCALRTWWQCRIFIYTSGRMVTWTTAARHGHKCEGEPVEHCRFRLRVFVSVCFLDGWPNKVQKETLHHMGQDCYVINTVLCVYNTVLIPTKCLLVKWFLYVITSYMFWLPMHPSLGRQYRG